MSRALRRRYGRAHTPGTVSGYQLGLVSGRQKYADYTWAKTIKLAEKEGGSENALRLRLAILNWGLDGQQRPAIEWSDPKDVRGATKEAKRLVDSGERAMTEVRGEASRMYAMKGFGDRAVFDIAMFEREGGHGT